MKLNEIIAIVGGYQMKVNDTKGNEVIVSAQNIEVLFKRAGTVRLW